MDLTQLDLAMENNYIYISPGSTNKRGACFGEHDFPNNVQGEPGFSVMAASRFCESPVEVGKWRM